MDIPVSRIRWSPCYRIISSRFPPIALFEKVADPADLDALYAIEALTNERLREEVGDLSLVSKEDRVSGPGSSPIMAAFTHLKPGGDRFTDGTFGAFYASDRLLAAVAETKYHRERFLSATNEPDQEIDMRVYACSLDSKFHDIRSLRQSSSALLDPVRYGASQSLARELREAGSNGIVYPSVRADQGDCVAVFRPRLVQECRQERHLCYRWSGTSIEEIYEKQAFG